MSDKHASEEVPPDCPGIIVSYWDDWGDAWSNRGLVQEDIEDAAERYPWLDLSAGLTSPLILALANLADEVEKNLREQHGLERPVRLSPGSIGIRGVPNPADGAVHTRKAWEALQKIFDKGGEIPNYRAFTGYHWNWDRNSLTDRPGHLIEYPDPAPNATRSGRDYTIMESIGQGFVMRNYLENYHRPLTFSSGGGGDWSEGDRTPQVSHRLRDHYGRYYEKILGKRNSVDIFTENSWPYGDGPVYNISGGWWTEEVLSGTYRDAFLSDDGEENARREAAIQAGLEVLKRGFRAAYNGTEATPYRKPFAIWDHLGKWQLACYVGDRLPRRCYADYWEILRRCWVWALSGGDGGTEFTDEDGEPNVHFLTKWQMLNFWKQGKTNFEAIRDATQPGISLTCPHSIPRDGSKLEIPAADMRHGTAECDKQGVHLTKDKWIGEWLNFEQEEARYTLTFHARCKSKQTAILRVEMGGSDICLVTTAEIEITDTSIAPHTLTLDLPLDADNDDLPELWARGNFLKLSVQGPGEIFLDRIEARQNTIVFQHGLRGQIEEIGLRMDEVTPVPFEEPDEFFIDESNDYRIYLKFDLAELDPQRKVDRVRLALLPSRFMHKDNYRDIGKMPTMSAYSCGPWMGLLTPQEAPAPLGNGPLDSLRIEAFGLWLLLDVSIAFETMRMRKDQHLSLVLIFHASGEPRALPGCHTNLGIHNSRCEHVRRRPKLLID